jgi:hypothetical protein
MLISAFMCSCTEMVVATEFFVRSSSPMSVMRNHWSRAVVLLGFGHVKYLNLHK